MALIVYKIKLTKTVVSENEQFEADKAQVINEITILEPRDSPCTERDNCEVPC